MIPLAIVRGVKPRCQISSTKTDIERKRLADVIVDPHFRSKAVSATQALKYRPPHIEGRCGALIVRAVGIPGSRDHRARFPDNVIRQTVLAIEPAIASNLGEIDYVAAVATRADPPLEPMALDDREVDLADKILAQIGLAAASLPKPLVVPIVLGHLRGWEAKEEASKEVAAVKAFVKFPCVIHPVTRVITYHVHPIVDGVGTSGDLLAKISSFRGKRSSLCRMNSGGDQLRRLSRSRQEPDVVANRTVCVRHANHETIDGLDETQPLFVINQIHRSQLRPVLWNGP